MRLESFWINNFKNIDENGINISLSPITLLFGPNNSGKSTIIKSLYIANEFFCSSKPDFDNIRSINIGNFKNYIHNHDLTKNITMKLSFIHDDDEYDYTIGNCFLFGDNPYIGGVKDSTNINNIDIYVVPELIRQLFNNGIKSISISFTIGWNYNTSNVCVNNISIYVNESEFLTIDSIKYEISDGLCYGNLTFKDSRGKEFFKKYYSMINEDNLPGLDQQITYPICISLGASGVPIWDSTIAYIRHDKKVSVNNDDINISKTILSPCSLARKYFKNFICIGALREIPNSINLIPGHFTKKDWYNGIAAWSILYYLDKDKLNDINTSLNGSKSLNIGYEIVFKYYFELCTDSLAYKSLVNFIKNIDIKPDDQIIEEMQQQIPEPRLWLKNTINNVLVKPEYMGTGISQIIPVIVAAIVSQSPSLVAIEQPELHIHPAWQVALGDVFIDAISKDHNKIFILETHSEHILLRFLRRIRDSNNDKSQKYLLNPNDISVYWIGADKGITTSTLIDINENGEFNTLWPEGFFEERSEELFG